MKSIGIFIKTGHILYKLRMEFVQYMCSKENMHKEKNLLLNISDLLLEKGLITEKERNAMKSIVLAESNKT